MSILNHIKLFLYLLFVPSISFAYIDPGNGILLWQGLMVALGIVLTAIKNPIKLFKFYLQKITNLFVKNKID